MEHSNCQLESFTVMQRKTKVCYHSVNILRVLYIYTTGIQISQDAHFYARTAKFNEVFNNEGKSLVIQFSVKHEQKIDCGGGYVKASNRCVLGCYKLVVVTLFL